MALHSSYPWIATPLWLFQMIAFSLPSQQIGLDWSAYLIFESLPTETNEEKNCFFLFPKIVFLFLFFFSLEKFNPYWLTQSQMLFFFFPAREKKKTAFLLTNSFLPKNCTKLNFSREIKKYGTFVSAYKSFGTLHTQNRETKNCKTYVTYYSSFWRNFLIHPKKVWSIT